MCRDWELVKKSLEQTNYASRNSTLCRVEIRPAVQSVVKLCVNSALFVSSVLFYRPNGLTNFVSRKQTFRQSSSILQTRMHYGRQSTYSLPVCLYLTLFHTLPRTPLYLSFSCLRITSNYLGINWTKQDATVQHKFTNKRSQSTHLLWMNSTWPILSSETNDSVIAWTVVFVTKYIRTARRMCGL